MGILGLLAASTDTTWPNIITAFSLTILGSLTVAGLGLFVRRGPLKSSNEVLRSTLADYKEAALLTKQQKDELTALVVDLKRQNEESAVREAKLLKAIGEVTIQNQELTARVEELEHQLSLLPTTSIRPKPKPRPRPRPPTVTP